MVNLDHEAYSMIIAVQTECGLTYDKPLEGFAFIILKLLEELKIWVAFDIHSEGLHVAVSSPSIIQRASIHWPGPYVGHRTISNVLIYRGWARLPVKFLLNVLEVTFDDSNVPRKACIIHEWITWLKWLWNRDIAKHRLGLDIKHITKENASPEVNKAYGAIFSSYGDNLAGVMKKVAFLLIFLEMLILYCDGGGSPSSDLGVVEVEDEPPSFKSGLAITESKDHVLFIFRGTVGT